MDNPATLVSKHWRLEGSRGYLRHPASSVDLWATADVQESTIRIVSEICPGSIGTFGSQPERLS